MVTPCIVAPEFQITGYISTLLYYLYTGAYITHLRDRHGERIKHTDAKLLPHEGYLFENDYVLLPKISQPAVLPPDSNEEDESNDELK